VPAVEEYGIEPIPAELRTVGWRDLFAINFTFFLNPVMYLLGAFAVVDGRLPLWWAVASMVAGQALAYSLLVIVAQPGVDYGLPGQVAMRASLGFWGARLLSSPYRVVAATYWFAAQALTGALGFQAIIQALTGDHLRLVPVAVCLGAFHATLAVLGFDVTRWLLRVVLPISLAFTGVLVGLYVASDDPRYAVSRVFDSPDQHFTWLGFAKYVTVMCGASLTLVTSVADFCRYTPTRRDMRVGYAASAISAAVVTTFVGGYAAAATGETNPFIAVADLTSSDALLVLLLAAIVVQGIAANITNVYTAGLSLANSAPRLGRLRSTIAVGTAAVALSAFPDFVDHAQRWITHLGNVAAPLAGVVVADYLILKRQQLDVPALFDPAGRYRYLGGVNVAALASVAAGVAVYYALPHDWLKIAWGVGVGTAAYLALSWLERGFAPRLSRAYAGTIASSQRSSSPS
jgi:NCS1 nucleoside transporter family